MAAEVDVETPPDDVEPRQGALELTIKGIIVGLILALLLGPANMYVGMRVGLTVSASIPAAVLSFALLRGFKNRDIRENNISQTIASSAEALAAGVIFTIPALLPAFLGVWEGVELVDTILIAATGGLLGVFFAVPLRKALIEERALPYPEGVACAAVLRAGHGGGGARLLMAGAVAGGLFAFLQLGLGLFPLGAEWATRAGTAIAFAGTDLSLILIGVGFLVGLRISSLIFAGGVFAWWIVLPLLSALGGVDALTVPDTSGLGAVDAAFEIWNAKIRLIGAGAMLTGGLLALWQLRSNLANAFREGFKGYGHEGGGDMPFKWVLVGVAVLAVPAVVLSIGAAPQPWQGVIAAAVAVLAGFLLSAVAGYMAGVVGSSNNPISGVTILALATTAGLLLLMNVSGQAGILGALIVGAIIACAAAISGDTMQDLKTGHMVGATPWKQQIGQLMGVAAFAAVAPFVLGLLDTAFGIGSEVLPAPQAGIMATILDGFFGTGLDLPMLGLGVGTGAAAAVAGLPVLPIAVGVYLPLGLSVPIFIGGVLRWGVNRAAARRGADPDETENRGTLVASGVIAGEAVAGIALAGLIVIDAQRAAADQAAILTPVASMIVLGVLVGLGAVVAWGRRRTTLALAGGAALAGLAAALWTIRNGAAPDVAAGPVIGLLVFAYGAAVVVFLALRPHLLARGG